MSESETGVVPREPLAEDPPLVWAESLSAGSRRTLSRLLTFAESSRADHQELVTEVLVRAPSTGCFRVAISGAPGVGKSCLLESLGMYVLGQGACIAVLSIDPSSQLTGGSILADKTRMVELSAAAKAYVRPSPSGVQQGGVARYTSKCLSLCERAGFDIVFLETVGVGQTELAAAELVDCFVMVASPSGGDELQGMKRGITEHADLFVVNKLDQDPLLAKRTQENYANALKLLRGVEVPTLAVSAHKKQYIAELWSLLSEFRATVSLDECLARDRKEREQEFFRCIEALVTKRVKGELQTEGGEIARLLEAARQGEVSPRRAAADVLQTIEQSVLR